MRYECDVRNANHKKLSYAWGKVLPQVRVLKKILCLNYRYPYYRDREVDLDLERERRR